MQPQTPNPKYVSPGAVAIIILLGLAAVVALVVGNSVFSIQSIEVEGNLHVSDEDIIALSGIRVGDSIFSLNATKIRDAINSDYYLEYIGIWKSYPDRVILSVKEDTPRAQIEWIGTLILLGKDSVVLERTMDMNLIDGVPLVKLSGISNNIQIGAPLVAADGQIEAIGKVLGELIAQNMIHEISELNASTLDNIYLITDDAVQVNLGTADSLPYKIAYTRVLLSNFRGQRVALGGAVLDVTTGRFADFRPSGV